MTSFFQMAVDESTPPPSVVHVGVPAGVRDAAARLDETVEGVADASAAFDPEPECLVCEHRPPERDARELLATAAERAPDCPVVVVAPDAAHPELIDAGATDCVRPDRSARLARRVENAAERRRAERDRSTVAARFDALVDCGPDAVVVVDDAGTIRYANAEVDRILGYAPSSLVGEPLATLVPEPRRGDHRDVLDYCLAGDGGADDGGYRELPGRHSDGHEVPLTVAFRLFERDSDRRFVGVLRDVSGRRAAETALEATQERYRTLVETCPDALFVADAETGTVLDANPAAEDLLGKPREEILGLHQSDLHPSDDETYYRRIFDDHADRGGITRRDGDLTVVHDDGHEVPVEISANMTELDGREVIYAVFRDVTERAERTTALASLRAAAREFISAETRETICQVTVETARDVLGTSLAAVHLFDADEDVLRPIAATDEAHRVFDGVPTFGPDESLAWDVYESGSPAVFGDVGSMTRAYNQNTPVDTEVIVPLDDHGVLTVGSLDAATVPDYALDFAQILAANAARALDRAEREGTLASQRAELAELNRINAVIREVDRALVRATTREAVGDSVVERLTDGGPYEHACIVERGAGGDVRSEAAAGETSGDPEAVATRAADAGRVVVEEGGEDLAAIPLEYHETAYGVLVVTADRASAFDDRERTVLVELGETIAYAIAAVESKKALVSDAVVELEFAVSAAADHFFVDVPKHADCAFEFRSATVTAGGSMLYYLTVSGASPEQLIERVRSFDEVERVRVVDAHDDGGLIEVVNDDALVLALADHGATLTSASAGPDGARAVVELPVDADVRGAAETIERYYPSVELLAQRERDRVGTTPRHMRTALDEALTDRQRTALEAAHLAGYFEWPRASTAEEVAESLGVTAPTFHQHLRRAESKLLDAFLEE
ncbi:PAS domain S-box protein [Halomicrococcus sp. NG-SE-24]|uniref:PAS domain S-box protein n=1 Tax=Halomicrococcus sp. NG-SE-24 TaxID=3436928 RepID=UPI003D9A087D